MAQGNSCQKSNDKSDREKRLSDTLRTSAQWKGQFVVATCEFKNRGGDTFHAGDRLIVKRKLRDGSVVLARPAARVSSVQSAMFMLDPDQR